MDESATPSTKSLSFEQTEHGIDVSLSASKWRLRVEGGIPESDRESARRWVSGVDRDLGNREYWRTAPPEERLDQLKQSAPEVFGPRISRPDQHTRAEAKGHAAAPGASGGAAPLREKSAQERAATPSRPEAATPSGPPQAVRAEFSADEVEVITSDSERVERYKYAIGRGQDPALYEQRYQQRQDRSVERELLKAYGGLVLVPIPGIVVGEIAVAGLGLGAVAAALLSTSTNIAVNQSLRAAEGLPPMSKRELGMAMIKGIGPSVAAKTLGVAAPRFTGMIERVSRASSKRFISTVERLIHEAPEAHRLKFLINPATGKFWSRKKGADVPAMQSGHPVSYHSGAPQRFQLEDADRNQLTANVGERQGHVFDKPGVEIDKVPIERGTAQLYENMGKLPAGTVASSPPTLGWEP